MDTYTLEEGARQMTPTRSRKPPRRMRSAEEKTRIVEETLQAGASVAEVARRHGVNANLLFSWRRLHQQGLLESHTRQPVKAAKLLPVKVVAAAPQATASLGAIEIDLPEKVRVRIVGDVSTQQLSAVLTALARCR